MKKLFQQDMIVGNSGVDGEEREGDILVKSKRVLLILIKPGEGNLSLCCYIIGGECCLEGFLDLGPVFISISDTFIFKLDEASLSKGFSSFLGHSIEENHGSRFIGELVHMKGKIGLYGHEPSVGISSFSIELFRKGRFDVYHIVIVFFI